MRNIKIVLIGIFIIGTITPFVDYLVIIQTFYLLIPFGILLFISVAYLFGQLIFKGQKDKSKLLIAFIIPTLVLSQIISAFTVDKIQRFRAEKLIKEIESTGVVNSMELPLGLNVSKLGQGDCFKISYSRGFLVREVYDSSSKSWTTLGWND